MSSEIISVLMLPPYLAAGLLALVVLLLGIFVVISAVFVKRLLFSSEEKEVERARRRAYEASEGILAQARNESFRIIQKANEESVGILHAAESLRTKAEKELESALRELSKQELDRLTRITEELLNAYHAMATEAQRAYLKTLEAASKGITDDAQAGVESFKDALRGEIGRYQHVTDQYMTEWQDKARAEIETYKSEVFSRIEKTIFEVVALVAERVLGRALDLDAHRELVLHALEEAKKEGFFDRPF